MERAKAKAYALFSHQTVSLFSARAYSANLTYVYHDNSLFKAHSARAHSDSLFWATTTSAFKNFCATESFQ